ncbi:MAG: ferritin family protein [Victivallales bacterium]|nr:ferritin family protein [Victivallales bacterium]
MIFNAREVFEIAERIERNGYTFYRKAAESVSERDTKSFLESLANMEEQHEQLFNSLKNDVTETPGSEFPDLDDQLGQYLNSYADGKIFEVAQLPENKIGPESSLEEIFETAIEFERNSVVFFTLIKQTVPESLGKEKIDILIKEEIKHIATLNNHLNSIGK